MRLISAVIFICIGIYIAFTYTEEAQQAYVYIAFAWNWIKGLWTKYMG
jgi:hypothetical protein